MRQGSQYPSMMSYPRDPNCPRAMNVVGSTHWSSSVPRSSVSGWILQQDAHIRIDCWSSILHGTLQIPYRLTRTSTRKRRTETPAKRRGLSGKFDEKASNLRELRAEETHSGMTGEG